MKHITSQADPAHVQGNPVAAATTGVPPALDKAEVIAWRQSAHDNGYRQVAVETGGKAPAGAGWQGAHALERLLAAGAAERNTGILTAGLQAIDIDIDDAPLAAQIRDLAVTVLGETIERTRSNAPRSLLLYRAAEGVPRKQAVGGQHGKLEVLGGGQQFLAHGLHPSGAPYDWRDDRGPHNTPRSALPAVTEAQVAAFLAKVQPLLEAKPQGAQQAARPSNANPLTGAAPAAFQAATLPDLNAAAQAGAGDRWYDALDHAAQGIVLNRCINAMQNAGAANWSPFKRIGMAIYAATAGWPDQDTAGGKLFQDWSSKNPCHDPAKTTQAWKEILASPPSQMTAGSLIHEGAQAGAMFSDITAQVQAKAHAGPTVVSAQSASPAASSGTQAATTVMQAQGGMLTGLPFVMPEAQAGALLNQYFGFAFLLGGAPGYFLRQLARFTPITPAQGRDILAPYSVSVVDAKGSTRIVGAWDWWHRWSGRYTVDAVAYDPENRLTGQRILNTYSGFAIEPKPGPCPHILDHLESVICSSVQAHYDYLLNWMAFAVQRPGTNPGVMPVLRSRLEGTGKSTTGELIRRPFGVHALEATSAEAVLGDFNDALAEKSFIQIEEGTYSRKYATGLMNLVTSETITINGKNRPRYSIQNCLHLLLTTNSDWSVPAGAGARRFFVLDVERLMPPAYFTVLRHEMDHGGAEAFLHLLLHRDIQNFDPRRFPVTRALQQEQRRNAIPVVRWLTDAVVGGALIPAGLMTAALVQSDGFGQRHTVQALYSAFATWCRVAGEQPSSMIDFGRHLTGMGFTRQKSNNAVFWHVPDAVSVLREAERYAGIRK